MCALDHPRYRRCDAITAVEDAYDFFLGAGMVTRGGAVNPVSVYGVDPENAHALAMLRRHMVQGLLEDLAGDGRGSQWARRWPVISDLLPGDAVALILTTPDEAGPRPSLHRFELMPRRSRSVRSSIIRWSSSRSMIWLTWVLTAPVRAVCG